MKRTHKYTNHSTCGESIDHAYYSSKLTNNYNKVSLVIMQKIKNSHTNRYTQSSIILYLSTTTLRDSKIDCTNETKTDTSIDIAISVFFYVFFSSFK